MKKLVKVVEIIAAGLVAASLAACVSALQGGCVKTPSGGYQCSGGYEPENQITAL